MSSRALAWILALLPVLTISGCNDEPVCSLDAVLTGGYEGTISWDLMGRTSCGFTDPSAVDPNSSALAFTDDSTGLRQDFYIIPASPALGVASFPGRVILLVGENYWESDADACEVTFTRLSREDWSLIDFFEVEGAVVCDGPLSSESDDFDDVNITGAVTFKGHIHADLIDYGFL